MKLTVPAARLIERRSDEQDIFGLLNQIRDGAVNQNGSYWRTLTTTDAVAASIWFDEVNASSTCDIWMVAVGEDAAGNIASYTRRVVVKRIGTGAASYVGAGTDVIGADKEDVVAWDAGFALDPTVPGNVYAYVQGAAATTINWRAYLRAVATPWE